MSTFPCSAPPPSPVEAPEKGGAGKEGIDGVGLPWTRPWTRPWTQVLPIQWQRPPTNAQLCCRPAAAREAHTGASGAPRREPRLHTEEWEGFLEEAVSELDLGAGFCYMLKTEVIALRIMCT